MEVVAGQDATGDEMNKAPLINIGHQHQRENIIRCSFFVFMGNFCNSWTDLKATVKKMCQWHIFRESEDGSCRRARHHRRRDEQSSFNKHSPPAPRRRPHLSHETNEVFFEFSLPFRAR